MVVRELNTSECQAVLASARIARLACARADQPYVVPVHIYYDGDALYSFATLGRKIEWMRENPRVCVQVDHIADRLRWATVVVFGRYEELLHIPSQEDARRRARELFQKVPDWWQPAAATTAPDGFRMPVIYRIRIETMTGRLAARAEQAHEAEPWWLRVMFEPPEHPH